MSLPPQYLWLEPVVIMAVAVFVCALLANGLTFRSRIISALAAAAFFILIIGAAVHLGLGTLQVSVRPIFSTSPITKM